MLYTTRNPCKNVVPSPIAEVIFDITAHCMRARLHVGKPMTDRCAHFFHGKAFAIIMDLHYNTLIRGPKVDIHVICAGMLGCIRQSLLANME